MEFMTNYKEIQPTYTELAKALKLLKLKRRYEEKNFVFVDSNQEVIVRLPLDTEAEKVNKARFVALSYNLADLGLLRHPHDLSKMIEKSRHQENQATA